MHIHISITWFYNGIQKQLVQEINKGHVNVNFGSVYIRVYIDTMCEQCRVRGEDFIMQLELTDEKQIYMQNTNENRSATKNILFKVQINPLHCDNGHADLCISCLAAEKARCF